jgi:allophanate hydrolase subunit 1
MNGLSYALRRIHAGENDIHRQLLRLAEQHHAEHEVHHVARDLAAWSAEHVRSLAEHARRLHLQLDPDADAPRRATEVLRAAVSTMTGRRPETGLLLLHDLRDLYLQASDNSLAWEMLAQISQARHERELLTLTEECHPQNLRQLRWANAMIKTQSPQILASL